jgi:hypothetical protein
MCGLVRFGKKPSMKQGQYCNPFAPQVCWPQRPGGGDRAGDGSLEHGAHQLCTATATHDRNWW